MSQPGVRPGAGRSPGNVFAGGAMGIRTPDLLHAMGNIAVQCRKVPSGDICPRQEISATSTMAG